MNIHAEELLKSSQLKVTPIRVSIIELLYKSKHLISAQSIHRKICNAGIDSNLSTVYRAIEVMSDLGIINEVSIQIESQKLYEFNHHKHHHFLICESCNKIKTVYDCNINNIEHNLEKIHNFKINHHNVEFYGTCEECRKKLNQI